MFLAIRKSQTANGAPRHSKRSSPSSALRNTSAVRSCTAASILHPAPDERVHAFKVQLVKFPKAATISLRLFDEDPLVSFAADVFQRALRLPDRLLININRSSSKKVTRHRMENFNFGWYSLVRPFYSLSPASIQ